MLARGDAAGATGLRLLHPAPLLGRLSDEGRDLTGAPLIIERDDDEIGGRRVGDLSGQEVLGLLRFARPRSRTL
jgi:hypothetical protein